MVLLIDNRATNAGPGLHALIVGVGHYDHLPSRDDPPEDATWGLQSLGSSALSAAAVADWLDQAHQQLAATGRLAQPLATLRVLLAGTDIEQANLPPWAKGLTRVTRNDFRLAVQEWRKDCSDNRDNVAFFYYVGHGFSRGRGDTNALLTFSDLFAPNDPPLTNTVAARNIVHGMAPQATTDSVARQQFLFFDCCRTFPTQMKDLDDREVAPVLTVKVAEGVQDDRHYGRFFAVPDTTAAFASAGSPTYFCASLIDALNRGGRNVLGVGWQLDGSAIQQRLQARYPYKAERFLDPVVIGRPLLRRLGTAPLVDLDVHLEPAIHAVGRRIAFEKAPQMTEGVEKAPGKFSIELPPGQYDFKIHPPGGNWSATLEQPIILPDLESPWVVEGWP